MRREGACVPACAAVEVGGEADRKPTQAGTAGCMPAVTSNASPRCTPAPTKRASLPLPYPPPPCSHKRGGRAHGRAVRHLLGGHASPKWRRRRLCGKLRCDGGRRRGDRAAGASSSCGSRRPCGGGCAHSAAAAAAAGWLSERRGRMHGAALRARVPQGVPAAVAAAVLRAGALRHVPHVPGARVLCMRVDAARCVNQSIAFRVYRELCGECCAGLASQVSAPCCCNPLGPSLPCNPLFVAGLHCPESALPHALAAAAAAGGGGRGRGRCRRWRRGGGRRHPRPGSPRAAAAGETAARVGRPSGDCAAA